MAKTKYIYIYIYIYLEDRTIAQRVHFKNCTFLSGGLLKNSNVKSPKFAGSENGNPKGKLVKFPFGTQRCSRTLHCGAQREG